MQSPSYVLSLITCNYLLQAHPYFERKEVPVLFEQTHK
jgi:hypothetical protein